MFHDSLRHRVVGYDHKINKMQDNQAGADPRGAISPLKLTKVTNCTMILYNSEKALDCQRFLDKIFGLGFGFRFWV